MKAKELVRKLSKLNPKTKILIHIWKEEDINKVLVALDENGKEVCAYIGDEFEELKYELKEEGYKTKFIK